CAAVPGPAAVRSTSRPSPDRLPARRSGHWYRQAPRGSVAQQCHELVGAPFHLRGAAGGLETIGPFPPALPVAGYGLAHHDITIAVDGELNAAAGREPEGITQPLGDGDLALDGDGGIHGWIGITRS